jgi:uncharacterized repeat protein (TIGR01451 family)
MARRGIFTGQMDEDTSGGVGLALHPSSRSFRATALLVVLAILAALLSVGVSSVVSGSPALAAGAAQGCGYADTSANNGTFASTTCWLDFSGFDQTLARQPGGQPMQVTLQGGYVVSFNATLTDIAGAAPMTMTAQSTPINGEARWSFGNLAYRGIPGEPALYSDPGAFNVLKGATVSFTNIKVVDSAGAAVTGFDFVAADAEDNVSGETFDWSANVPLNIIETLAPNGGWGCKTPSGVGTDTISCSGSGAGGSTSYSTSQLVSADSPTTFATTWDTAEQSGIAIGIRTAKLTLNKQVVGRVNAADSFDISATSPQGTLLGAATTGTTDTATTGGLTVLPQTGGGNYTLSESATSGSPAVLSNYDAEWSCVNATSGSSTALPSGAGTSKALVPAIGDDITCTVTNTAKTDTLAMVKHAGSPVDVNGDGITDAGDTIQYTFTVTNTGQVAMGNIGVTDAKAGAVTCPDPTLAAGASETCTADNPYTITAADVTAGAVNNSATAQGSPPGSTTVISSTPSTTSTPTITPAPALTVVKSADPSGTGTFTTGQTITYNFVVTNTGNVPLNDITIDDGTFSGTGALSSAVCPDPSLAVNAQEVCTANYTLTQADVDAGSVTNTATADGTPPGSTTPIPSGPSTVTIPTPPQPGISMVKSATPTTVTKAGQTVSYSFLVTNTGNVTMSNITIDEGNFSGKGTISAINCPDSSLVAGQVETCTATYTATQADVDAGTLTNTATAQGTPPGSTIPVPSNPSTSTVTIPATPAITVKKTADVTAAAVGEKITYSFLVTNTGNVTETDPTVTDSNFSGTGTLSAITCPTGPVNLAPGDTETCTATYTVTQADVDSGSLTNTATTTATPPTGDTPPTSPPSTVNVPLPNPSITVVKTANPTTISKAGQTVTYSFHVTNTGNVSLSDVAVTDSSFSGTGTLSAIDCPYTTLLAGTDEICTATYTVTQADVDAGGSITNTATVGGTPPGTIIPVVSTPSTSTVTVDQAPGIAIVKTVSPAAETDYKVGEVLTYSFAITNTGDVTETNVAPDEGNFTGTGTLSALVCPAGAASLAPGAAVTCTATYTVTQADVDAGKITNAATATGTTPGGDPTPSSNTSTVTVPTPEHPALALDKTASVTTITTVGQAVTYSFKITNTGDVTEENVKPAEGAFNGSGTLPTPTCPAAAALLAPGASVTCTAVYHVTLTDLSAGTLSNTATAVGTGPNGDPTGSTPSTARVAATAPVVPAGLAFTGISALGPMVAGAALLLLGVIAFLGTAIIRRRRKGNSPDEPITGIEDLL